MTAFVKMHGLGNDFVVFDARNEPISLSHGRARTIADRRLGVGCDQVIVIENSANGAEAFMRIYNADGGEVESCGNAARCVGQLLMDEAGSSSLRLDTKGGLLICGREKTLVSVDMGPPRFDWREIPLSEARDTNRLQIAGVPDAAAVSMGNPHCVLFVDDAERVPVETLGPAIETSPLFPNRTNVEFAQVLSSSKMRLRVWERGTGVTLACGTGACAAAVAAQRRGLCSSKVDVVLDGGSLTIEWQGGETPVFMTGPAAFSFRGEVDLAAFA